jgi:hypothetical protein
MTIAHMTVGVSELKKQAKKTATSQVIIFEIE